MKSFKFLSLILMFVSHAALANKEPRFQDFPTVPAGPKRGMHVNYADPIAKRYRTKIKQSLKNEPNFAGHYHLIEYGCGSECTNLIFVNDENGKVINPGNLALAELNYNAQSRLLITTLSCGKEVCGKRFYLIDNDQLKELTPQ